MHDPVLIRPSVDPDALPGLQNRRCCTRTVRAGRLPTVTAPGGAQSWRTLQSVQGTAVGVPPPGLETDRTQHSESLLLGISHTYFNAQR